MRLASKNSLLMKILHLHVTIEYYRRIHASLPGLEASPEVML
jgi:hypothetical protein